MSTRIRTLAMFAAMTALPACAQQTPPEKPQVPEEETPYPEHFRGGYLELGWGRWDVQGNENRFRQYGSPPRGLYVRRLILDTGFKAGQGGQADLMGLGHPDRRGYARYMFGYGDTRLNFSQWESRFFDPTPQVVPSSSRLDRQWSAAQKVTRDSTLSVGYQFIQQNKRFEGPKDSIRNRSRVWDAQYRTRVGNGNAGIAFSDTRFVDRLGAQPDSDGIRWSGHLDLPLSDRLDLGGQFSRYRLEQDGRPDSKVDSWRIQGGLQVDGDSRLEFGHRRSQIELPVVENAFVRDRSETKVEYSRRFAKWSGRVGYRHIELERVRGDQTFADVLKWNRFEASGRGRINDWLQASVSGSVDSRSGDAPMTTDDSRSLIWDEKRRIQVKLDASGETQSAYLAYAYNFLENDERGIRIRSQGVTLGGARQISPKAEVFAEVSSDRFSARAVDAGAPGLDDFFLGSNTYVFGLNLNLDDANSMSLQYSRFATNGDNPLGLPQGSVRISSFQGSFYHRTPGGIEWTVSVAPWIYTDRVFKTASARTTVLSVTAGGRISIR